jgi:hypothetical protein
MGGKNAWFLSTKLKRYRKRATSLITVPFAKVKSSWHEYELVCTHNFFAWDGLKELFFLTHEMGHPPFANESLIDRKHISWFEVDFIIWGSFLQRNTYFMSEKRINSNRDTRHPNVLFGKSIQFNKTCGYRYILVKSIFLNEVILMLLYP